MMRHLLAATMMLVVALGAPRTSQADEKELRAQAKLEVDKAALHYRLGRFEEALASYTRAYELFNAPALLFNIGQCHKNLKNHERAIFFFQGYLREETNPEKRALAEDLLAKSRADLERQRLEAIPPAAPPPAPAPAAEPLIGTDLSRSTAAEGSPAPEGQTAVPLTRKWWFWTALGAGALAIAGGTIAYYATGHTTLVTPMGSLGTLDRR